MNPGVHLSQAETDTHAILRRSLHALRRSSEVGLVALLTQLARDGDVAALAAAYDAGVLNDVTDPALRRGLFSAVLPLLDSASRCRTGADQTMALRAGAGV